MEENGASHSVLSLRDLRRQLGGICIEKPRRRGSEKASSNEAHIGVVADDYVVQNTDAEQFACFLQPPGNLQVFPARGRVAARVVVDQNDGRGRLPDRGAENLAGVNDALIQGSFRNLHLAQDPVLSVQEKDQEILLAAITETVVEMLEDLGRGREAFQVRQSGGVYPLRQGECRQYS